MENNTLNVLKINTAPVKVLVTEEAGIVLTRRGYIPHLTVEVEGISSMLMIGSLSLGTAIEPLRIANNNSFKGLAFTVKKESEDKFAKYIVS